MCFFFNYRLYPYPLLFTYRTANWLWHLQPDSRFGGTRPSYNWIPGLYWRPTFCKNIGIRSPACIWDQAYIRRFMVILAFEWPYQNHVYVEEALLRIPVPNYNVSLFGSTTTKLGSKCMEFTIWLLPVKNFARNRMWHRPKLSRHFACRIHNCNCCTKKSVKSHIILAGRPAVPNRPLYISQHVLPVGQLATVELTPRSCMQICWTSSNGYSGWQCTD